MREMRMRRRPAAARTLTILLAVASLAAVGCDNDNGLGQLTPTSTPTVAGPAPTDTPAAQPTNTAAAQPTNTAAPQPTNTAPPATTDTPGPQATDTPAPQATNTAEPQATATPGGSSSDAAQAFIAVGLGASLGAAMPNDTMAAVGGGAVVTIPPVMQDCPDGGMIAVSTSPGATSCEITTDFNQCHTIVPGQADALIDGVSTQMWDGAFCTPAVVGQSINGTFVGSVDVTNLATGDSFSGTLDVETVIVRQADSTTSITIDGTVDSACTGQVDIATTSPLVLSPTQSCPLSGELSLTLSEGTYTVLYLNPGVELTAPDTSVQTFSSCDDAALARCPS